MAQLVLGNEFSRPQKLRPCCAFGFALAVEVASVPVPAFEVQNVVDPRELGFHTYEGGVVSRRNPSRRAFVNAERNGLVYTCRGGFVDLAHVRDYADWTAFLAVRIQALLESGGLLDLGEEAGGRFVYLEAIEPAALDAAGRPAFAIAVAKWLAFQLSVWHETATWYGFASVDLFPERASAFSPEDFYSNLVGIELAGDVLAQAPIGSEEQFNRAMDIAIHRRLRDLGAQPTDSTVEAFRAVDGRWWDSRRRVPDPDLVRRRNFELGPEILPWLVPPEVRTPALVRALDEGCEKVGETPSALTVDERLGEIVFAERARIEVRADLDALDPTFEAPADTTPWLTQQDLPAIVSRARAENLAKYGDDSDRP